MNVAIIGGGACGLFLASLLEQHKIPYCIFNRGKTGRKLLASGNGKCNLANMFFSDSDYHGNPLAHSVLQHHEELLKVFEEMKIYTKTDKEGRIYPISESSFSVYQVFMDSIHGKIVDIEIEKIEKREKGFILNDTYCWFDKVVLCCGSPAGFVKDVPTFSFLEGLGLKRNPFIPSLVGFKTALKIKDISGVRAKCMVSLKQGDRIIHKESGEVIFKDNGISGICVMNLSSYYAHLKDKRNCSVVLDLLNGNKYDSYKTVLPPKLYSYCKKFSISPDSFCIPIQGVYEMEYAQVCSGGIDIDEIEETLQLKKDKDVYIGGEMIDVDGVCGGYNLMFAFCCALIIAKEIENVVSD